MGSDIMNNPAQTKLSRIANAAGTALEQSVNAKDGFRIIHVPHQAKFKHDLPAKRTNTEIHDAVAKFWGIPEAIRPYLTLSAAHTIDADKGHIEAYLCQNVDPTYPRFDFLVQHPEYEVPEVNVFLTNLSAGDSFYFQFRFWNMGKGKWTIATSVGGLPVHEIPMAGGEFQSLDFFVPPLAAADVSDLSGNMIDVQLQAHYQAVGVWLLQDVIIVRATFVSSP